MDVPTHSIDVVMPPVFSDLNEVRDYYIKYQREQFQGLIAFLEQQTGRKMDKDRLWETIRLGDEAWRSGTR